MLCVPPPGKHISHVGSQVDIRQTRLYYSLVFKKLLIEHSADRRAYASTGIYLVLCVSPRGKHISLVLCVNPPGKLISLVLCAPTLETHIPSVMCHPTWETHIPSVMCSPTCETHVPSAMCSPRGKHISLVLCVPPLGKHISLVPPPGKNKSLVLCVPPPWMFFCHFSIFFILGNIGHENVFYDLVERKNACLAYKKKKFKKVEKLRFLQRG